MENLKTDKNILIPSAIFLFFLFFFALLYSPATQGHYLVREDYALLWTSEHPGIHKESFASYIRTIPIEGRPLETLFYYIVFNKYINLLKSYEPVNTVRFTGIIGIGLLAFVLFLIFKENKYRTDHAFFLSILICTLPPFQIYLGQLICVVFIFSVLLSALSILILFKAVFKEDGGGKAHMVIAVPTAIILLIASLLIYPPTATTYWAMALIPLIMINEDFIKKWRLLFTLFSTGFASMIIFFIITKTINLLMNTSMVERGDLISITDIYSKIIWFITNPLYTSLNLWNIVRSKEVGLFVSTVIFAGILYGFGRVLLQIMVEKKGLYLLWNSLSWYLLVLALIPLSYCSHLVIKVHSTGLMFPHHRTLIGPEIVVVLLFYWGLMNIAEFFKSALNFSADLQKKIVTISLVILTVVAAFLANHNIEKFAKHLTDEYRYVKDVIKEYGVSKLSQVSQIYIVGNLVAEKIYITYGEFYSRSAGGLSGRSLTNLALYELGMKSHIPITYIRDSAFIPSFIHLEDKDELIIDMSKKYKFPFPEDENILIIDMSKKYKFPY